MILINKPIPYGIVKPCTPKGTILSGVFIMREDMFTTIRNTGTRATMNEKPVLSYQIFLAVKPLAEWVS